MSIRPITGQELHKEINMGKSTSRQKYIHNLAKTMMGQFKIPPLDLRFREKEKIPENLFSWYGSTVEAMLIRFSDHTLGKIAASGLGRHESIGTGATSLFDVRGEWRLPWEEGGRPMVLQVATVAVIAAMVDIVRARTTND